MKFGHFDDSRREYVIETPMTPQPWINYLGNEDFFSLISNTMGGYSFYKDAKMLRITRYRYNDVPRDTNGRYYYIRHNDTVFTPGWQPVQTPLDKYECHHGLGYTEIFSEKGPIAMDLLAFVPLKEWLEVNRLKLKNTGDKTETLDLYSYVEFCFWNAQSDGENFQRNLSLGEIELVGSTIYHKTEYRERRNHYAYYTVNSPIDGFDTQRDDFIGVYNGTGNPKALAENTSYNSIASGGAVIGSHHIKVTLEPGEEKSFIFLLGYNENPMDDKWEAPGIIKKDGAVAAIARYQTDEQVDKALADLRAYWDDLLSIYQAKTGDEKLDRMVNIWNQYQCMVTFNMSRSASYYESGIGRGMGFRDSSQDLFGFVHLIPDRARQRILDIAATQFQDGSAYHQYQPLTKQGNADIGSGFNDDPLWLVAGVAAYIKETGDDGILDEMVAYDCDMSVATTLLEHLRRSFNFTRTHLGPHGLPLIGRADWNDCLNLNCFSEYPGESFQTFGPSEGPVAESVFIAGMFVKYGKEYAEMLKLRGFDEEAADALKEVDKMYDTILSAGWDGEWFIRAYDAFSNPVGSHVCEEGQIFIESNGFCVLADVGIKEGKALQAMNSVRDRLDTKYGIVLQQPAYTKYHLELGEISSYPPGYKENAGIFCHNNPWVSIGETRIGRGSRAFEIWKKTAPAYVEEISEIHSTEPYVYSQMVAGKDAPHFGEAKNSWLTGTAAWTFVNVSQYILGIRPEFEGLAVDPCVPADFKELCITRKFRGSTYKIHVTNPDGVEKGIKCMTVNGKKVEGNIIPPSSVPGEYEVEAVMG